MTEQDAIAPVGSARDLVRSGPTQSGPGVIAGIQYLRGLCALFVVVSHENGFLAFPEYFGRSVFPSLHEAAVFSVAAFFAISGFIIVVTSVDENGQARIGPWAFARKRITRIVPFLWFCTVGYAILRLASTGTFDAGSFVRTLIIWPTGELRPNVAWSLRHELAFYLVFAMTMLGRRQRTVVLVVWLSAPVAHAFWVSWVGDFPSDLDPWSARAAFANLVGGGENGANLQFMIGMAIGVLYLRGHVRATWPIWVLLLVFLASCVSILAVPLEPGPGRQALWTILAGCIVWVACRTCPAGGRIGRAGLTLGNASFAIYLVHNLVMLALLALSSRVGIAPNGPVQLGAYLGCCVAVSIAVCCAVHHSVERPLIAITDSMWRKLQHSTRITRP